MSVAARARIAAAQCARWACLSVDKGGPALDKSEGVVKDEDLLCSAGTAFFAREVEDQDSGNLTLNHISVEDRFHQPSIRPSTSTMILLCEHPALCGMRERPINNLRSSLRRPGPSPSCRKIKPTLDVSCFLRPSPRRSSSVL